MGARFSKNTNNEALPGCYPEFWENDILKNNCSIPRENPKISELPLQKIPWKNTDLKRNFVILEIINSISSLKNEEISFVLL